MDKINYESDDMFAKYAKNDTRNRCLNIPEKIVIDKYDIKNKDVLVIGSGGGRLPANLTLYGNHICAVEKSKRLYEASKEAFGNFPNLYFLNDDMMDLSFLKEQREQFDVVYFAINVIDCVTPAIRIIAIDEAIKKLRKGGLLIISSREKLPQFNLTPLGFVCDVRNKFDKLMALNFFVAKYYFPWITYIFKK